MLSGRYLLVCALKLLWYGEAVARKVHRDVATSAGLVRGYLTAQEYYAYLGVPYARHSRRDRFKAPKPPRPWDGTFEATHRVRCPQPDGSGHEDCLVANVFTPEQAASLPVLVIVHGGGFQSGWGLVRPPTRLLTKDLVIVTFNYRVSVFGFLCLGTPAAPGNAGLKDQVAALYWIHRNIAQFGGNPYDVTVYGVRSGAAAVQLLLLSGSTKGLIHRAIIESGSALSPLSLSYDPLSTAIDVAKSLGYEGTESPKELGIFYNDLPSKISMNITSMFLPCLEKSLPTTHSLLERDLMEIFKTRDYQSVPMLIAYTNTASEISIETELKKLPYLPENFEHMLPNNLAFESNDAKHRVANVIRNFYIGKEMTEEKLLKSYVDYINDVTYEYPIVKSSLLFASANTVPVYLIKFSINQESESLNHNSTQKLINILDYFYNYGYLSKTDEIKTAQLTTLWQNFIKIGDPTPITTFLVPVIWQPISTYSESDIKTVKGLYFGRVLIQNYQLADERIIFWDHIYQNFYRLNIGFNNDVQVEE